ncbi:hypothetical protein BS78_05G141400 [Paspalum vaginatum]|uniref:Uncharacterized protein n=1 Tax=Paspalum vaginatum TaxID=158149 RepID=A0A9W7XD45_9POAL|nr:hypothetical protein BS78_K032300 [Paspalum vaginatum]KAJ1275513.1 hypothetical protein BS78_05G141400 [Paspalum vaginatum]
MNRSEMIDSSNKLRVDVHSLSSSDESDRVDHEAQEVAAATEALPPGWSHHHASAGGASSIGNNRRRLLSKQLSMKETTREAKWEKRRRQILQRSSMVSMVREEGDGNGGGIRGDNKSTIDNQHLVVRSSSERVMRCLTDEDLDELRGSFELGFGFDEETGGAHLRDTLPALDFYFAVNRQLSEPKLRTLAASPTSTLSAVSSSSTLPDTPSPSSPISDDAWKIFCPGENPQLVKTRLRHWAQVVACSIKHGC